MINLYQLVPIDPMRYTLTIWTCYKITHLKYNNGYNCESVRDEDQEDHSLTVYNNVQSKTTFVASSILFEAKNKEKMS